MFPMRGSTQAETMSMWWRSSQCQRPLPKFPHSTGLWVIMQHFIKRFAHITRPLYNVLGKEVKMGSLQLPTKVQEVVRILKDKIQSTPVLVFPDFGKPFLLETDVSKEGLGAVLSQKQDDGCYHPITFGSHSLTPSEKNYQSSKLEFLALKWSVTEHFKEYLMYALLWSGLTIIY